MARTSIGRTSGGAVIALETTAKRVTDLEHLFAHFSERDKYDAVMALRYLALSEDRKDSGEEDWLDVIEPNVMRLESSF